MKKSDGIARFFYMGIKLVTVATGDRARRILRADSQSFSEHDADAVCLLCTNNNGSVISARAGSESEHHNYTAYGYASTLPSTKTLSGFNGEMLEPLMSAYLLGAGYRAFSPTQLRFHSPDDLSPFGAGGLNCYMYCNGDPINNTDSSGHMPLPNKSPPLPPPRRSQALIAREQINTYNNAMSKFNSKLHKVVRGGINESQNSSARPGSPTLAQRADKIISRALEHGDPFASKPPELSAENRHYANTINQFIVELDVVLAREYGEALKQRTNAQPTERNRAIRTTSSPAQTPRRMFVDPTKMRDRFGFNPDN